MSDTLLLCAKPGCHRPRQVIEKSKGTTKYMKTCCRHGVDDIPPKIREQK